MFSNRDLKRLYVVITRVREIFCGSNTLQKEWILIEIVMSIAMSEKEIVELQIGSNQSNIVY